MGRGRGIRARSMLRGGLLGSLSFVAFLHVLGVALMVVQAQLVGRSNALGVGVAVTAYTLGMRHAFDADHIAAIDNTTRRMLTRRTDSTTVGFWFSLGHSSVVFIMVVALGFGVRALATGIQGDDSTLQHVAGIWGTSISGLFLLLIGLVNLTSLMGLVGVLRQTRSGDHNEAGLEALLEQRGWMYRVLGRVMHSISKPWHMYPAGFLFGLGFDTVSEIGLLVLAGGAATTALPWWTVLALPILFAAGMSLLDTLDGAFMSFAYGWSNAEPMRRIYYNITVTALSVFVALAIGSVELLSLLARRVGATHGPLAMAKSADLNYVGFGIVGLFILTWAIAIVTWKLTSRPEPENEARTRTASTSLAVEGPGPDDVE